MQPFSGVSKDFGENESFYIISQQSVCGQKQKNYDFSFFILSWSAQGSVGKFFKSEFLRHQNCNFELISGHRAEVMEFFCKYILTNQMVSKYI